MRPALAFLAFASTVLAAPQAPDPRSVAILYNKDLPESAELAAWYAAKRSIPADNLIGLDLPRTPEITRKQFNETLLLPLRKEFDKRGWWRRAADANGILQPVASRIQVLVTIRGVPLKIQRSPKPAAAPAKPGDPPPSPQAMLEAADEASVDSDLFLFGVEGPPAASVLKNQYHESTTPFAEAKLPFMVLVGRIDGPDDSTCRRMVEDALATEQSGLWGRTYIDLASKVPQGDEWLTTAAKASAAQGFPTVIDRFSDTLPTNYPMTEAAVYLGWYSWNADGPFLNPKFHFRRGAIAAHIHSFSATQLNNTTQNWCGPLLARGAAATLGNVYEPYLHLSHNFGLFYQRLLDGFTLVEAATIAVPAFSWQTVVLGDPLYRPYLHRDGTGMKMDLDREYRALRLAQMQWGDKPEELDKKLENAATSLNSGTIQEARGLRALAAGDTVTAAKRFEEAKGLFITPADRIRMEFHQIAIQRAAGNKASAIQSLRSLKTRYAALPETAAATGWLNILDPPPPPPADPNKGPKNPPK